MATGQLAANLTPSASSTVSKGISPKANSAMGWKVSTVVVNTMMAAVSENKRFFVVRAAKQSKGR
jgi:hypothetical protein